MVFWISVSVSASIDAVASSNKMICRTKVGTVSDEDSGDEGVWVRFKCMILEEELFHYVEHNKTVSTEEKIIKNIYNTSNHISQTVIDENIVIEITSFFSLCGFDMWQQQSSYLLSNKIVECKKREIRSQKRKIDIDIYTCGQTLELRSSALAIHISCLSPTEKFSPFSNTSACSFPSSLVI